MAFFLGIDTSNYTTSTAVYDSDSCEIKQAKKLLPVQDGQIGLRQSDAVFHHTKQLPEMMTDLFSDFSGELEAVGVSDRPCTNDKSYMPCFLVGLGHAQSIALTNQIPVYTFSHQQGHVAAAALGANRTDLLEKPLLAFHVSGGTTDLIYVTPDEDSIIHCQVIAKSLDLKAGQLVDRVGHMLGLPFPAGPYLDDLSLKADERKVPKARISMEQGCCHLSGIQNQCQKMFDSGTPKEEIALYSLKAIQEALSQMLNYAIERYGDIPILFAGGVMSNQYLREKLGKQFNGVFAPPKFSSDNATGIAWLASQKGALCKR